MTRWMEAQHALAGWWPGSLPEVLGQETEEDLMPHTLTADFKHAGKQYEVRAEYEPGKSWTGVDPMEMNFESITCDGVEVDDLTFQALSEGSDDKWWSACVEAVHDAYEVVMSD